MSNKKKTCLFLITLAAMLGLMLAMAGVAYAEDAVEYQEASWDDANKQVVYTTKSVSSYTRVTSNMDTYFRPGWYVVDSDVTIEDDYIHCTEMETVNLILCDGCTLTVSRGIVTNWGLPLNIYGQSVGTGELIAEGEYKKAGIGGANITIHGGTVTAAGGDYGAGIGGGENGAGGVVTIYGGTVTATGGFKGAGIGGGENGAGGVVTIYGGTVTATGGVGGAGIGGGEYGEGKTVTIYGGTVTATGGVPGAGIGGGSHGAGGPVAIHGGLVIATGGEGGFGIGGAGHRASHGSLSVADGLLVYGDDEDPYPTTLRPDFGDRRWINMKVDCPHAFTFSASGAGLTATCSEETCSLPDRKTELTINAPERTIYGDTDKSAEASLTGLRVFRSATMISVETSDIKYYKATVADNVYTKEGEALTEAPSGAGTYVAELTVDDATASVGYTIAKADSTCSVPPAAKEGLVYNGSAQELVDAGEAEGGTMSYALGSNKTNAPASGWNESIPKGKAIQTYYVWYKVAGDANHEDSEPFCVEVKIAREDLDRVRPDSWSGNGTEEFPYVISTKEDWNALAELVGDGYSMEGLFFKLDANIEVTEMVGTYDRPFSGSFDGGGHTLTFNAEDAPPYCAPFAYTNNASFKNLHIAGTIKTNQKFAAGLIGLSKGRAKVTDCRCSIIIESSVNGDGTHGGFIAKGGADFEGCVFDGELLGPETAMCGGFLGWADPEGACSFRNCLFAPQELTLSGGLEPFGRHVTAATPIENCYYTKNIDRPQGKAGRSVTADEGITVGAGNATEYKVTGITAHDTGLVYEATSNERVYYAGKDEVVPVSIPSACDGVTVSAGALSGAITSYTLTMPDENVTLTLNKGVNHAWGAWTPLDENQHQRVCGNDPDHKETGNHAWDEGVVTKAPTAEEPGVKTFTCDICKAERTETIPIEDIPIDPDIPVVNTAKIHTKGNFTKKQMKLIFPADKSVTNYRIQHRMAGKKTWKSSLSTGTNTFIIRGLKKSSLCEFRIAGFVEMEDGSWVRGNWSKISYRYMSAVPLKTIKADKKRLTVTWKKDRKASGYEVRYSLKKSMAGAKTIYVKGGSKTKLTIKKLKSGKKYYVQIRPAKVKSGKKYVGILTSVKAARVK